MACFGVVLALSPFVLAKLRVLNDMWQHYSGYWHLAASSNLYFLLFLVASSSAYVDPILLLQVTACLSVSFDLPYMQKGHSDRYLFNSRPVPTE